MILNSPFISGSLTVTGNTIISGSITAPAGIAGTASYASNAELLDGLDSTSFTTTSSFNAASSSLAARIASNEAKTGSFATTGSNSFYGNQSIVGSNTGIVFNPGSGGASIKQLSDNNIQTLVIDRQVTLVKQSGLEVTGSLLVSGDMTATGTITAQTLVVQTVTSSVDFVTGSTRFGSTTGNTHQFTGSVSVSGSQTMNGLLTLNGIANTATIQTNNDNNILVLVSSNALVDNKPRIELGGTGYSVANTNFYRAATQIFTSAYASTEYMRINSSGQVGIGITNPSYLLDVNGTGRFNGTANTILTLDSNNTNGYTATQINYSGTAKGLIGYGTYLTTDGGVAIRTATSTPFTIAIGGATPNFTISSSGAATFSSSVTAGGNINLSNDTGLYIKRADGTLGQAYFLDSTNNLNIGFGTADAIRFATYLNNERVRITSAGNVGIGTTSPGKLLHLYASNDNASIRFTNTAAAKVWDLTPALPGAANAGFSIYNVTNNIVPLYVADNGITTLISDDNSGARTTINNVLTIKQTNGNAPYSGFGSAILFNGTTYNGSGAGSPGVRNWGRIGMYLNDSSVSNNGESMFFSVAEADNSDTLGTAMTIRYDRNIGIGTPNPAGKFTVVLPTYTNEDADANHAVFGSGTSGYGVRIGYSESGAGSGYINVLKPGVAWSTLYVQTGTTVFNQAGNESMRINSSGVVAKPRQPFFSGALQSDQSISATTFTPLAFRSDQGFYGVNTNSCWNNSTYTFTAPVTGVYLVSLAVFTNCLGQVALHVNGTRKHSIPTSYLAGSGATTWGGSAMIPLTAGEGLTLQGYASSGGTVQANQYHTWATIYLLG